MFLIISAFAAPAINGQVPDDAAPAGAPDASDDGRSPWERYVNGGLYSGVFSIHDTTACSKKGAEPLFGSILMQPKSKIGGAGHDSILGSWIQTLRTWHGAFVDAGDMVVRARHTCVGIIDSGKPNATSYYAGYLVFDPRAMMLSIEAPGLKFHRVEAILAHEYAHQLQYWHGSVFRGDRSARRIELAADCMAAGMIAIQGAQNTGAGPVTMYAIEEGVGAAFRAVGDGDVFEKGHHGSGAEREQMARAGVRIALEHYRVGGQRWRMHSGDLKTRCEQEVMTRDSGVLKHPSDLLDDNAVSPSFNPLQRP